MTPSSRAMVAGSVEVGEVQPAGVGREHSSPSRKPRSAKRVTMKAFLQAATALGFSQ